MVKKLLSVILCGVMLLCLAACSENETANSKDASVNTYRSQTDNTSEDETGTNENAENGSSPESMSGQETTSPLNETGKPADQTKAVFVTENIARITFYAYYGNGKGSEVPTKHMADITRWLGTFTVDEKAPDIPSPGTNTVHVEIEYTDGTVIKKGLDTTTVDGVTYNIKRDKEPDCYSEILSHTSIS